MLRFQNEAFVMKKYFLVLFSLLGIFTVISFLLNISIVYASDRQKIFKQKGCGSCHYTDKGKDRKPYPTKQILANMNFNGFKNIVKNGKPGTAMKAYNLADKDIKAIYDWLQQYK